MPAARSWQGLKEILVILTLAGFVMACAAIPRIEAYVAIPERWDDRTRQEIGQWMAGNWLGQYIHLMREQNAALTGDDLQRLEVGVRRLPVKDGRDVIQLVCSVAGPKDAKTDALLSGCQRILTEAIDQTGPQIAREVTSRQH